MASWPNTAGRRCVSGTEIAPGGYTMFIDLQPDDWTLIVSNSRNAESAPYSG